MDMNEPLILALMDFAKRSGIEDIKNFADVFSICKSTGGNLADVVRNTYTIINQKIDIKNEIQVIISEQKLSQKILNFVPFGLLILLSSSSPDYIQPLYSAKGNLVMFAVLLLLGVSNLVSSKITNIEV
jgi:tight adherence protein B